MPFYFGEGDPGWDEGDEDERGYRPPKASQFHYEPPFRFLPGPKVVSVQEPAPFSDQVPPPLPVVPSSPDPQPPAAPAPGLLDRLTDRLLGSRPPAPRPAQRPTLEEQRQEWERRGQHAIALFVAALREIGARRLYCRYDGGNDEGFAWLDHAELRSGERLEAKALAARLAGTQLLERLADARLGRHQQGWTRTSNVHGAMAVTLVPELAGRLLGPGYGTGSFCMYGAFTVDLDTCTIADDRNAEPIVQNIEIEE